VKGLSYPFNVTTTTSSIISVWIDYNHDGTFATNEWTQVTLASTANVASTVNITIPTSALIGPTRMRVRSRNTGAINGAANACTLFGIGETEDYTITIVNNSSIAPVANFTASATTIQVGQSVSFTDASTNNPTSWSWIFAGGTPSTSTTQNPTNITYNTAGVYAVTLTATNSAGTNTSTQTNYITVLTNTPCVTGIGGACGTGASSIYSFTIIK
jgi:PKD repeat protein